MVDDSPAEPSADIEEVRLDQDIVLIEVSGEIDIETSPALRELYAGGDCPPVLVLDLSKVTFFSSSGLAALMALSHRVRQIGSELRVVAGSPAIRRPIELTGLNQVLALFSTRSEALAVSGAEDRAEA